MGQMLSVLINERTGTTVEVVQSGDVKSCHETVLDGKANIYINYIGEAFANSGGASETDDLQEAYTLVSQRYLKEFGMVWLKPFGFQGPADEENVHSSLAAPVTTKNVLRKFPVLDRVINKLGGKIDSATIEELEKKAKDQDIKKVVKEFLKGQRLI
jgi:glycine betaine/choline ABC-type transport system substrate-binding protein